MAIYVMTRSDDSHILELCWRNLGHRLTKACLAGVLIERCGPLNSRLSLPGAAAKFLPYGFAKARRQWAGLAPSDDGYWSP